MMKIFIWIFLMGSLSSCSGLLIYKFEAERERRDFQMTDKFGNIRIEHNCQNVLDKIEPNENLSIPDSIYSRFKGSLLDYHINDTLAIENTDVVLYEVNKRSFYVIIFSDSTLIISQELLKVNLSKEDREFINRVGEIRAQSRFLSYYNESKSKTEYFRINSNYKYILMARGLDRLTWLSKFHIKWHKKNWMYNRVARLVRKECKSNSVP